MSTDIWTSVAIGIVTGLIGSFLGQAISRRVYKRRKR